jgi:hypothetical protein
MAELSSESNGSSDNSDVATLKLLLVETRLDRRKLDAAPEDGPMIEVDVVVEPADGRGGTVASTSISSSVSSSFLRFPFALDEQLLTGFLLAANMAGYVGSLAFMSFAKTWSYKTHLIRMTSIRYHLYLA